VTVLSCSAGIGFLSCSLGHIMVRQQTIRPN
jgi:hypothetical protein